MRTVVLEKLSLRHLIVIALSLQASWLAGCSGNDAPELPPMSPVSGVVHVDGKPMSGVTVLFYPADNYPESVDPMVMSPHRGTTDADGKFQLTTYNQNDGAPAGEFVVGFYWAGNLPFGGMEAEAESRVDPAAVKFNRLNGRLAKSPIDHVTVETGKPVDLGTIELKTK